MNGPQLSRRHAIGVMAGALAATVGASSGLLSDEKRGGLSASPPPAGSLNILMIIVDDMNDYVGYMGGYKGKIVTPNLDALAGESLAFMNFHVAVPVCDASRATLLWGESPLSHGLTSVGSNLSTPEYAQFSEAHQKSHIIRLVGDRGYRTCGGGKVFHDGAAVKFHPEWWTDGYLENKAIDPAGSGPYKTGFSFGELPDGQDHPDATLTDWCIEKMRSLPRDRPFLMAPGLRLPHLGWYVPKRYVDMYPLDELVLPEVRSDDWDDLGPIGRAILEQYNALYGEGWYKIVEDSGSREQHLQYYLASTSHTDEMVGRLLNELASQPYADETVVMLISDNGYHQGEHMAMRKLTLNNESTRVPFLIRAPKGAGFDPVAVTRPYGSIDSAATVLDVAGVEPPETIEGTSLRGPALQAQRPPVTSYAYNSVSIISETDRWTLHRNPDGELMEIEHYDEVADPGEFTNLMATWRPGDSTDAIPPEVLAQPSVLHQSGPKARPS